MRWVGEKACTVTFQYFEFLSPNKFNPQGEVLNMGEFIGDDGTGQFITAHDLLIDASDCGQSGSGSKGISMQDSTVVDAVSVYNNKIWCVKDDAIDIKWESAQIW